MPLGIIGAGNMAEAIARGITEKGLLAADQIIASDPAQARLSLFNGMGLNTTVSNNEAAGSARTVLLCVKPQTMAAVLADIRGVLDPAKNLIITIAAGIGIDFIRKHLGADRPWRIIRAMPNTPMLVGQGATAICAGQHATPEDLSIARGLFEAASTVVDVDEKLMNAVTALSGSGPAYFYYLIEHMIEAGTRLGLSPLQSATLVTQTAIGAARLLEQSGESPQELRRRVTSPGGTTDAALRVLNERGTADTIIQAITAAEKRGTELGQ